MEEDYLVLTEEEERMIQEGQAAADLLDSPIFLTAIERVRAQCAEQILESAPDKQGDRENLYNLSRGLSAVTAELMALAALGETTLTNAKREAQPAEEVQDDPDLYSDY